MTYALDLTNFDAYLEDTLVLGQARYIEPIILQPKYGFVPQRMTVGYPEVREIANKKPNANGTSDFTSLYGARAVTLEVSLAAEARGDGLDDQDLEDLLRQWSDPRVRAYLYYRRSGTKPYRRALVRPSNLNSSINVVTKRDFTNVILAFKAIRGSWESPELHSVELQPSTTVETGRSYDQAYDKTYPASSVIGAQIATDDGNTDTYPVITVSGPCTQPRIENKTTGQKLEFKSTFSLTSDQFLVIDVEAGTVLLNGDAANSRYDKIDFDGGVSEWWPIVRGENLLRYYPLTSSSPSKARVEWRSRYM